MRPSPDRGQPFAFLPMWSNQAELTDEPAASAAHWDKLENWPSPTPIVVAALLELRERMEALSVAVEELQLVGGGTTTAPAAEPLAADEPTADAVAKLAGVIRDVASSHALGATVLAEAILSHPATADIATMIVPPAPEWPVLPEMPLNTWPGSFSPPYRKGIFDGYNIARNILDLMNPNRQQEGRSNG
jgi:hypothetical protein